MGVQQTEIDTLAALQPDGLQQMARDAIAPFFVGHCRANRARYFSSEWPLPWVSAHSVRH